MLTESSSLPFSTVLKRPDSKSISHVPWIQVAPDAPYFITEKGEPWTPIGQNDAITWPDLSGFYKRKNLPEAEKYIAYIASQGVTCMRLMLEYCQVENRYFEKPLGSFHPAMICLWDDLLHCCEKYGIRVLLTPFDTFWMRKRWQKHPYNQKNGGPCQSKSSWLCCSDTLQAVKERMSFVIERWGKSGVIFAWDLWNEPDPLHAKNAVENIATYISQLSKHIRKEELRLYGRTHLQTVGGYWPHLLKYPAMADIIFCHPNLDFATIHFYGHKALDEPTNTFLSASRMGDLVQKALAIVPANRPFFDSEHGPIHSFRRKKDRLSTAFDEEYFRYTQWAHLASGGAGGGLRWPYRHPHQLTKGMRQAQKSLAGFTRLVNWHGFSRKNRTAQIKTTHKNLKLFACSTNSQVIVWLLTKNPIPAPQFIQLQIPAIMPGNYQVIGWNTLSGHMQFCTNYTATHQGRLNLAFHLNSSDLALLIKRTVEN